MKYRVKVILLVLLLSNISLVVAADLQTPRLITVTGTAELHVVPDEVVMALGVETSDINLQEAKKQSDHRVSAIITVAKSSGVLEKDIQTDHINIYPRYDFKKNGEKTIENYIVEETIMIVLRDPAQFETLMSRVFEDGANKVYGVQFRTSELHKYKEKARLLAVEAARKKAQNLAKALGQKIGQPYQIEEQAHDHVPVIWRSQMNQNVMQAEPNFPRGERDSFALGQIKVNAVISISFELETI